MLENLNITSSLVLGDGFGDGFMDKSNLMSVILFFAAALIIFWVLFRARNRRGRGRGKSAASRSAGRHSYDDNVAAQLRPQDLDRWNVEMHETARDLSAQIDTKMVALQVLIRSAQEEEARLKELIEKAEEANK